MMARISPLRMSNDTPLTALTPPKESDTFSTERSVPPAAVSEPVGALTPGLPECDALLDGVASEPLPCPRMGCAARPIARSCGLLHDRRDRDGPHVANLDAGGEHALAAVLERHLGRDVGFARAVIERADERRIAFGDEAAADLLRAGDLAVVGVELLVQDQEAANLRARHGLLFDQRTVHGLDVFR